VDISKYVGEQGIKSVDDRILNAVRKNPSISLGTLINKMKNVQRSIVMGKLQSMVDAGTLTAVESEKGRRGPITLKFNIPEK